MILPILGIIALGTLIASCATTNSSERPPNSTGAGPQQRPDWVDRDVPEHGKGCFDKKSVSKSSFETTHNTLQMFSLAKAKTSIIRTYCPEKHGWGNRSDFGTIDYYFEERPNEYCGHSFVNWNSITCRSGRVILRSEVSGK